MKTFEHFTDRDLLDLATVAMTAASGAIDELLRRRAHKNVQRKPTTGRFTPSEARKAAGVG
jgi:hypothetical protein